MNANRVGTGFRRRGRAEGERLVSEFEQSGLGRKEFSVAHGLSVHTLDAWRRRVAGSVKREEIVPVEIVADRAVRMGSQTETPKGATRAACMEPRGQLRVVLGAVLCIEVDPGFDASELRRLIVVLDSVPPRNGLQPLV